MARSQGACLFFCFAGKDRTGVIAALLLMLAQVDTDDVAADYQVTYTYIRGIGTLFSADNDIGKRPAFLADKDKTLPARPEELRRTEPEWLQPFMDYVQGFGGAERYLSHLGLSHDEITRLRDRILL
jgi:protein-tyrosine phosphatase